MGVAVVVIDSFCQSIFLLYGVAAVCKAQLRFCLVCPLLKILLFDGFPNVVDEPFEFLQLVIQ